MQAQLYKSCVMLAVALYADPDVDRGSVFLLNIWTCAWLRWDHANISLYRDLTGLYLQPILQHLTKLESCGGCSLANLEQICKDIVRTLKLTSDETIPTCKKDIFKVLVGSRSWWIEIKVSLLLLVCVSLTIIGQPWNSVVIRRV